MHKVSRGLWSQFFRLWTFRFTSIVEPSRGQSGIDWYTSSTFLSGSSISSYYLGIYYRCNCWLEDLHIRKMWTYGEFACWYLHSPRDSLMWVHAPAKHRETNLNCSLIFLLRRSCSFMHHLDMLSRFLVSRNYFSFTNSCNFQVANQLDVPKSNGIKSKLTVCLS